MKGLGKGLKEAFVLLAVSYLISIELTLSFPTELKELLRLSMLPITTFEINSFKRTMYYNVIYVLYL